MKKMKTEKNEVSSLKLRSSLGEIVDFYRNFKTLTETSGEIFWILDLSLGKLIYVSPAFKKIWGYDSSDLYKDSFLWIKRIHPEDRTRVSEAFRKIIKTKKGIFEQTYRIYDKDKNLKWIHAEGKIAKNDDGKAALVVGTAVDITKFKNISQKEEDQRIINTSIIENLPDMIFLKDAKNLRFELFNRAGERLIGMKREKLIGKNDFDFFPKKQAEFFTKKDREVLVKGKVLDIPEEEIKTLRGTRILHTKKVPILDKNGKATHLLGISEDITYKKKVRK